MRKFLSISLFVLSGIIYSQDFNGTWKVISYEDEIIYYNKTTDSLVYKDIERKEEAETFKEMAEFILFSTTYEFINNNMNMNSPLSGEISTIFEIDSIYKTINIKDKNSITDKIPYTFENETLFIEMKMEEGYIKIGLKKN